MAKAKPVPEGFHTLTPHLVIEGAAQAIAFYEKAFGAKEITRMPASDGERLMHAEIVIGNSHVMIADDFPEFCGGVSRAPRKLGGSPVTLHLYVPDVDAAMKRAIAAGAKETMPAADMFWGDRYGKVADKYGHVWGLATHIEDVSHEECEKRAANWKPNE